MPRATGEVRAAFEVTRQQRALAQQAAPHVQIRGQLHPAELRAVNVRDSVLLGEPLIDEGVIRGQQVQNAAVFVNDAAEEQLDFALIGGAQVVVEIREQVHHRLAGLQRPHTQPLAGEVGDQRIGLRIGQHAPHLLLQHRRVLQLALRGEVEQFIVRHAAPQEERQAAKPARDR